MTKLIELIKKSFCLRTTCPLLILVLLCISLTICLLEINSEKSVEWQIDDVLTINVRFGCAQYQMSLLLCGFVTIPMAVDIVLDCFTLDRANFTEVIGLITRVLLILSVGLPNLWIYFQGGNVSLKDYICLTIFLHIASRGCVCLLLSVHTKIASSGPICASISILYAIGSYLHFGCRFHSSHGMEYTALVLIIVAYCQFLYIFGNWGVTWIISGRKMDSSDVSVIICFVGLLILCAGSLAVDESFGENLNPMSMSLSNYLYLTFMIVVMTFPGQVVRFNLRRTVRKMEEKEAFIRYISHEIRTPLNTVFLGMNYIKGELNGIAPLVSEYVEPILETVNEVNNCCEVALSIVNDLLTFDKLEEGKMSLELKETEIERYVTETIKPFDIQAREKDITISFVIEDVESQWENSFVLRVDQHKMSQVMRNLVSNAIKFTPVYGTILVTMSQIKVQVATARRNSYGNGNGPSQMHPKVSMKKALPRILERITTRFMNRRRSSLDRRMRRNGSGTREEPHVDYLRIEVKDSGAGISEENQKRLFGQYVQFNAGKLQEGNGSGLGLWISKGITELHGGCIGASSKGEGKGSTFFLELPLFAKSNDFSLDATSRSRMATSSSRKMSYRSKRIEMHPRGSGFNSSISLADLISLDRKIRSRAGSSDYIYNSEISDSQPVSGRHDTLNNESPIGREDLDRAFNSAKFVTRTSFNVKTSHGKVNFSAFFGKDTFRIACNGGALGNEGDDLDMGSTDRTSSGPCLKPRLAVLLPLAVSSTVKDPRHITKMEPPDPLPRPLQPIVHRCNDSSKCNVVYHEEVPPVPGPPELKSLRILVVDDSVPTRKLMCRVLSKKGHVVLTAEDGVDCLRIIDSVAAEAEAISYKNVFDVVIMDDNMPKMSGREASKILRERGYRGVICGVTGNTSPEDALVFKSHGADMVFPKPLDLHLFERVVAEYLSKQ